MNQDGRKRVFARLHAAAAVFALLLSWLSPALRLMANEPDVCGMACCVAEGHCCCAKRKHFVKGHVPGADGRPAISENELKASCPLRCAQPASGFHHLQFPKAPIVKYAGEVDVAQSIYARTPRFARDALADDHAAPRAPPLSLL
ncbi:MAG TPA: hypothetical protein VFV58_06265 [Blastocatellia bacterium]|jgi:hypothetical protein|nr:hypothetical protein [Blastocatellia bacterium]